ncbi:MAG: class I SAM-dependent methyltransferase [Phycisphaerae bacterium]|nr:class I SAM-dependent methyltransferase [Phycisphaerae bacterium]
MHSGLIIHEDSYKKGLASYIHQKRLKALQKIFYKYVPPTCQTWVDFGCSNGFIPQKILERNNYSFKKIMGYDHNENLIELARKKNIPNAEFECMDLNRATAAGSEFDVATCFETLEHVGNYKNAFVNIYNNLKKSGIIIITVPNETGMAGLIKFLGRLITGHSTYGGFFTDKSCIKYAWYLLKNKYIDGFRTPGLSAYGFHLGFDYRRLKEYIYGSYLKNQKLELIDTFYSGFRTNVIMVFRKLK